MSPRPAATPPTTLSTFAMPVLLLTDSTRRRLSCISWTGDSRSRSGSCGYYVIGGGTPRPTDRAIRRAQSRLEEDRQMTDQTTSRTGGQLIAECLRLHGVDTIFTVPGESFLAVLDGLHDVKSDVRLVVCRQEGGA